MTAIEFNLLPLDERGNITFNNGTHVNEYAKYNDCVVYSVHNYFVEVVYDVKNNQIRNVIALVNKKDFEGYLNCVRLRDLNPCQC